MNNYDDYDYEKKIWRLKDRAENLALTIGFLANIDDRQLLIDAFNKIVNIAINIEKVKDKK